MTTGKAKMRTRLVYILIAVFITGPVWGDVIRVFNNQGLAIALKKIENPFLKQVIVTESRSLIDYTILDKLTKRKA